MLVLSLIPLAMSDRRNETIIQQLISRIAWTNHVTQFRDCNVVKCNRYIPLQFDINISLDLDT